MNHKKRRILGYAGLVGSLLFGNFKTRQNYLNGPLTHKNQTLISAQGLNLS
jgi:hypothetical protein